MAHMSDTRDRYLPTLSHSRLGPQSVTRALGPSLPSLVRPASQAQLRLPASRTLSGLPGEGQPSPGGLGPEFGPTEAVVGKRRTLRGAHHEVRSGFSLEPRGHLREAHSPAPPRLRWGCKGLRGARPAGVRAGGNVPSGAGAGPRAAAKALHFNESLLPGRPLSFFIRCTIKELIRQKMAGQGTDKSLRAAE